MWQSKTFVDQSLFGTKENELRKAVCQFLDQKNLSMNDVKISEYEKVGSHKLVITVYYKTK